VPAEAGPSSSEQLRSYWAIENGSTGTRQSTGAGAIADAGMCASPGWIPVAGGSYCELPCGTANGLTTVISETILSDGGTDADFDIGANDSGVELVRVDQTQAGVLIPDTELCIAKQCPLPFAVSLVADVGILYVPYQCKDKVSCECLPPNVCGTGTCSGVTGNIVTCKCPNAMGQ
jgi:hypothetical protein